MSFQDQFEKFEASQGNATETIEEPVNPAESADTIPPVPASIPPIAEIPPVEEPATPPIEGQPPVQQPDYNKFLEESSGGLFKSVDEFKGSLEKVKSFDQIKKERDDLEAKYSQEAPANDFVKKYNELVKAGKTQAQIDSFVKINQLGDLSQLDPYQIKVEKLVQDGYKRDVAERKITQEFGLNIEIEGEHLTDDQIAENKLKLEDAKEELRVSALQSDLPALQELKVKLSDTTDTVSNNKALAEAAQLKTYQDNLTPVIKTIASAYKGIGALNVNGGEGDKAKIMNFEAEPEFQAIVERDLYDYFKDGTKPVNDQTVAEARVAIDAMWLHNNKEKFAQTNYNQGYADAKIALTAEFENTGGVPLNGLPPTQKGAEQSLRDQQKRAALGLDDD